MYAIRHSTFTWSSVEPGWHQPSFGIALRRSGLKKANLVPPMKYLKRGLTFKANTISMRRSPQLGL
jgi:hypothetical protein